MRNDPEFIHGTRFPCHLMGLSRLFLLKGPTAFSTFAVDNNACAGSVGAKDPLLRIEHLLLLNEVLSQLLEAGSAFHTITAFSRHDRSALMALASGDLLMAVGAFHVGAQLFLEVTT